MKINIIEIVGPQATYIAVLILSILGGVGAYVLIERTLLSVIKKSHNKKMVAASV